MGRQLRTFEFDLQLVEGPSFFFSELSWEGMILKIRLKLGKGIDSFDEKRTIWDGLDPYPKKYKCIVELIETFVFLMHLVDVLLDLLLAWDFIEGQILKFLIECRWLQDLLFVIKEGLFGVSIEVDLIVDEKRRERILNWRVHVAVCIEKGILYWRRMVNESL